MRRFEVSDAHIESLATEHGTTLSVRKAIRKRIGEIFPGKKYRVYRDDLTRRFLVYVDDVHALSRDIENLDLGDVRPIIKGEWP